MTNPKRIALGLGLALALAAGLFVVTVSAEPPTPTPTDPASRTTVWETFIERLAQNLGITKEALTDGLKQTRNQMVDEAVANGKLTQEQADKLKSADPKFLLKGLPGQRGQSKRVEKFALNQRDAIVEALASLLNKSTDEVREQLRPADSLDQFLKDNNLTQDQLRDAVVKVVEARLKQAVENGKLTQEQADKILEGVKNAPMLDKGLHGGWFKMPGNRKWHMGEGQGQSDQQ